MKKQIYSRFSSPPQSFVEDYEMMLVIMTIIAHDIRRGVGVEGNCHSVARALAKFFPNFEVIDGYIPRVAPKDFEEENGTRAVLAVQGIDQLIPATYRRLYHSWLLWKGSSNLIIDPWPVGGGYGFSPPLARYQDSYDIPYIEASFPDMFDEERVKKDAESFYKKIIEVSESLLPDGFQSKKAA